MTPAVVGDDAIAMIEEEHHRRVPIVGRQAPAMAEHDRLRGGPVKIMGIWERRLFKNDHPAEKVGGSRPA